MTDTNNLIRELFSESINCSIDSCDDLSDEIIRCGKLVANQLIEGKKVFTCGNGGGASDAQYLSSRLLNRFDRERPSLPAFCLASDSTTITTISNDQNFNDIFSKQIRSLGEAGDILIVISTSGKSSNLVQAVQAAHEKQLFVVVLSGNDGGTIEGILGPSDIELRVKHANSARVKETHLIILHCICELIDQYLFDGLGYPE